jgi:hypothetical protein
MVNRPADVNAFEFVVLAALRAQQLLAGSVPRMEGDHSAATMAQMEVAGGCIIRSEPVEPAVESRSMPAVPV